MELLLPLEPDLDYAEFAVSVRYEDIPALPSLLAGLSNSTLRRKREALARVHRKFLWDETYGTAYEAVVEQMERRLQSPPPRWPRTHGLRSAAERES